MGNKHTKIRPKPFAFAEAWEHATRGKVPPIEVVNIFKCPKGWESSPQYQYIGRAGRGLDGPFGNPCIIGRTCPECGGVHSDGGSALACYEKNLHRRIKEDKAFRGRLNDPVERARKQWGLRLVCFCSPKPCHGDVLAKVIRKRLKANAGTRRRATDST